MNKTAKNAVKKIYIAK